MSTYLMVAGSRTLDEYDVVREKLEHYTRELGPVTVVTGEWRNPGYGTLNYVGADLLAEKWASHRKIPYKRFEPLFEDFPNSETGRKAAFHARNREMVEFIASVGGFAILFWDGRSPGTASVLELLKKHKVEYRVVKVDCDG